MLLPTIESVKSFATIGATVQVHSFGCWFDGTVTKFGKKNITVTFTTSGGTRTKTFQPGYVVKPGTYATSRRGQPEPKYAQRCKTALWYVTRCAEKAMNSADLVGPEAAELTRAQAAARDAGCEESEIEAALLAKSGAEDAAVSAEMAPL